MNLFGRLLQIAGGVNWLTPLIAFGLSLLFGAFSAKEAHAQLCVQLNGTNASQDFNTLSVSGSSNIPTPIGFDFSEAGSDGNILYAASNGSTSTGNTYSFGTGTTTDRALGEITSSTVQSTIGACFVNATDHPITSFLVSYTGEQWRSGVQSGAVDRLDFQFSTDATTLTTGTYINVNALDFPTPNNGAAAGALDGNAAANRTVFAPLAITPSAPIQPEAIFFVRWSPVLISGDNDGLAIDDFTLGAAFAPGLAGDYNNDGTADAADYIIWRAMLNQSVTIPNDITPGNVTQQDFNEWKQRFGKANPPGSGASFAASAAIPEPATGGLLLAVAGTLVLFRRRPLDGRFARRHLVGLP